MWTIIKKIKNVISNLRIIQFLKLFAINDLDNNILGGLELFGAAISMLLGIMRAVNLIIFRTIGEFFFRI